MEAVPAALLAVVQELDALWQRHAPGGHARHSLFHDAPVRVSGWPLAVRGHADSLDVNLRAIACLLANGLAPAAGLLLREALLQLLSLDQALCGPPDEGVAQYYSLLLRDVPPPGGSDAMRAYGLYGELAALYLDLLCVAQPQLVEDVVPAVKRLRRALHEQRAGGARLDYGA